MRTKICVVFATLLGCANEPTACLATCLWWSSENQ